MLQRIFIIKYLFTRSRASVVRTIALVSVGGVGVGVMAMVVVLSVMNGFDDAIRNRLLNVESHIHVKGVEPTPELEVQLKQVVGSLGSVQSFAQQDVIIRTMDGYYSGGVAKGLDDQALTNLAKAAEKIQLFTDDAESSTSFDNEKKLNLGPREIAVGIELAHSLGIFTGDEINILAPESLLLPAGEMPIYERVKVKALLRTDVPQFDSESIVYQRAKGMPKLSRSASLEEGYQVRLIKVDDASRLVPAIKKVMGPTVKVQTWESLNPGLFYSLKMEKLSMSIFLGLTILVSCFSIVTVLVLLVTEKKTDVGVLRAMGATKVQIRNIFLSVGAALGLAGILGGVTLGLLICFLLDRYPIIKLPNIYYDTSIPVSFDWFVVVGIVVLGALLTIAGTFVPAWRVAQLSPVDAIRRVDE